VASIVFTGSVDALKGSAKHLFPTPASKHGCDRPHEGHWPTKSGQYGIRVKLQSIPVHVDTDHARKRNSCGACFRPDLDETYEGTTVIGSFTGTKPVCPVPWMQPQDISNAILYLVSDGGPLCHWHDAVCWIRASWPSPSRVVSRPPPHARADRPPSSRLPPAVEPRVELGSCWPAAGVIPCSCFFPEQTARSRTRRAGKPRRKRICVDCPVPWRSGRGPRSARCRRAWGHFGGAMDTA